MSHSSEAIKLGLIPPPSLTSNALRLWINENLDPDEMGYADEADEGVPESELEYHKRAKLPSGLKAVPASELNVIQYLTEINFTSSNRTEDDIEWLVIHYTGNKGDTAKANCSYYSSAYRGASAHYFVDENSIYQNVLDKDISWHCGGRKTYYSKCRNSTSIGIEMCSDYANGAYYISEDTVARVTTLVRYLMDKYGIDEDHIIRHYDVTHKICPRPWVYDESLWTDFLEQLDDAEISELVASVCGKIGSVSTAYWEKVLNKKITAKSDYVGGLFGLVCKAAGESYTDDTLYAAADGVLNLSGDEYWPEVMNGERKASATNMRFLFEKIDKVA